MVSPFRNKTFKGLRWQKKVQRLLQENGLTLKYYLRTPKVESLDFHFRCCLKYNRDHFIFNPLFGNDRQYLQPSIFLFSEDELEISINQSPFQSLKLDQESLSQELIQKQLSPQIVEDRLYPWKMDQMYSMVIRLKNPGQIRTTLITNYHEANVYKYEADYLKIQFKKWINENLSVSEGPEHWSLISERLKFLNLDYSADNLFKNAREIAQEIDKKIISLPLLDVAELVFFMESMREHAYNVDLLDKVQKKALEVSQKQEACLAKFLKD